MTICSTHKQRKIRTHIFQWLLLITLLAMTLLLYAYISHQSVISQELLSEKQADAAHELTIAIDHLQKKINEVDVLLLPIYNKQSLDTDEKLIIIEAIRSLEGSNQGLSQSMHRYQNDLSRYVITETDQPLANSYSHVGQSIVHTTRLARTIDLILSEKWTNKEQREILVDHFNTARWALQQIDMKH